MPVPQFNGVVPWGYTPQFTQNIEKFPPSAEEPFEYRVNWAAQPPN